ncbi:MAG: riboflavin synthase [Planctomycetaceae bacterium]|nr:riboflavin synthase [Planctomycetaceae bacterium]
MFSGIIETMGKVKAVVPETTGCRFIIEEAKIAVAVQVADSVAVNGCCLTVIDKDETSFTFQVSPESLSRTNLGKLTLGSSVNLERALSLGDRLGGHFVSGHVDGLGTLVKIDDLGEYQNYYFSVPKKLAAQMASKGSVAVDGVSLTLVNCEPELFSVALIPYTLKVTTLGSRKIGDLVNIETDILSKYVQRLLEAKEWQ